MLRHGIFFILLYLTPDVFYMFVVCEWSYILYYWFILKLFYYNENQINDLSSQYHFLQVHFNNYLVF